MQNKKVKTLHPDVTSATVSIEKTQCSAKFASEESARQHVVNQYEHRPALHVSCEWS